MGYVLNSLGLQGSSYSPLSPLASGVEAALKTIKFRKGQARNTDQGLFINIDCMEELASSCRLFIRQAVIGGSRASVSEVRRTIGQLTGNELFYLTEEPRCMVGYLIKRVFVDHVKVSTAKLISCSGTLLPADPIFRNNTLRAYDNGDVDFTCGESIYRVTKHAFDRFVEETPKADRMLKGSRGKTIPLREMIVQLGRMLSRSANLECLSPEIQRCFKDAGFRGYQNWVFVMEGTDTVKTCFKLEKIPATVFRRII